MTARSPFESEFPSSTVWEQIGDATVPWRFTDLGHEYGALRGATGLLDLSGAALLEVAGPGAEDLLTRLFTREVEFLSPETSIIGMFLAENGTPIDLCTVARVDDGFLVETAVGRGDLTRAHLQEEAGDDVAIRDRRGEITLLGFEGPNSWDAAQAVLDEPVTGLPFQGVRPVAAGGVPVTVSRSGFTGEFGFKLLIPVEHAAAVWQRLAEHSVPAGHEALEVAMVEVRQPVLHREAGGVIEGGFNWLVDLEKEDFLGRDALLEARAAEPGALAISFVCDPPVVATGTTLAVEGTEIGRVLHAVHSPGLGKVCGIARVNADFAASGIVVTLERADGPQVLRTVSAPARIPVSWGALLATQES